MNPNLQLVLSQQAWQHNLIIGSVVGDIQRGGFDRDLRYQCTQSDGTVSSAGIGAW